jgi:glycosyltransferase involved in cell wall biosynthesis
MPRNWAVLMATANSMADPTANVALTRNANTNHVTVILATHNRRELVGRAIRSVLSQTFPNWNLLIVDDGSSDGTETELSAYANDKRITIIRLDPARGGAAARNAGLDVAQGDLIAFLDDDDVWHPAKLQAQVSFLDLNPDVDIVSCSFVRLGDHSSRIVRFEGVYTAEDIAICNSLGSFSFCMVRRDAVGASRIDDSLRACQDWSLWLQVLQRPSGRGVTLPDVLVDYDDTSKPCLTKRYGDTLRSYVRFLQGFWHTLAPEVRLYHLACVRFRRVLLGHSPRLASSTLWCMKHSALVVRSIQAVGAKRYAILMMLYARECLRRYFRFSRPRSS